MKRFCVLLLTLCLILSGCMMEPAESLFAVPKQSEDFYNLQSAIAEVMLGSDSYAPPTSGENQQAVQTTDLDGDGEDEAVVYIKTSGEKPLSLCVFDKTEGQFRLVARVDGVGTAFDHVQYVQVDDRNGNEIVIGRQLADMVMKVVTVYSLRDGVLTELLSANYTDFIAVDLEEDGLQGVFLLRDEVEASTGVAEYYHWKEDQLLREREARLTASASEVRRIITGKMCEDLPAVFVAERYGESAIVTDIFGYRHGEFTNLSKSDETDTSVSTVREYYVYSGDIDGDKLIELPRLIPMQVLEAEESSRNQSMICWYNLQRDGSTVDKLLTYHNYSGGWYLMLPWSWETHLAVTSSTTSGGSTAYSFWYVTDGQAEELFSICALSGEQETMQRNGWTVLAQKGDQIYAGQLGASSWAQQLTISDLVEMFRLIRVDWKNGET